ncbi:transposase [Streptomyces sp. NPDC058676]|uniref:transposase n=1 Tax=unclassified Streptomyces TaxID=2593676 RepID=UPI00365F54F6
MTPVVRVRGCVRTPAPVLTGPSAARSARVRGKHQMVPGWPYSIVAAWETGRVSWTAGAGHGPPGARSPEPGARSPEPGARSRSGDYRPDPPGRRAARRRWQWKPGDPGVLVVLDAGYDAPRIAHLLDDLRVEILGRLRSGRVMRGPAPPRVYDPEGGRPPKHGGEFVFGGPATWGTEQA